MAFWLTNRLFPQINSVDVMPDHFSPSSKPNNLKSWGCVCMYGCGTLVLSQATMEGVPRRSYPVWYRLVKLTGDKERHEDMQSHTQQM